MAKSKPGKSVYIKREVADILQQIKDAKQEDRLLTFLSQNLEVILDVKANITVIGSDLSGNEEEKVIQLNEDQEIAIRILNDWFGSDDKIATLSGASGTGKTFTIGYWIKQLKHNLQAKLDYLAKLEDLNSAEYFLKLKNIVKALEEDETECVLKYSVSSIVFLAPTHKAKNILKHSLVSCNLNFSPSVYTVAQALGKQPIIVKTGEEEFVKQSSGINLSDAELVIVDEASMVSKKDYNVITEIVKKVLFMGDKNQLPPVKESESLAFVNPPDCELNKVMRYSGHILHECTKLRQAAQDNLVQPIESDGNQIIRLNRNEALLKAIELFKSKEFEKNSAFCRIVAYRNKVVDNNNKFIKPRVYGKSDDYFKGLKLIAAKPVQRKSSDKNKYDNEYKYGYGYTEEYGDEINEWEILCNNSEEVIITSDPEVVEINEDLFLDMPDSYGLSRKLYHIGKAVRFECLPESGLEFKAIILDKVATFHRNRLIKEIMELHQEEEDDKYAKDLSFLYRWGDNLKDVFCSTVHKSQGSTYNHIFLDLKDILKTSQNKYRDASYLDDRPKLLYTAVSRASEKVYLID